MEEAVIRGLSAMRAARGINEVQHFLAKIIPDQIDSIDPNLMIYYK